MLTDEQIQRLAATPTKTGGGGAINSSAEFGPDSYSTGDKLRSLQDSFAAGVLDFFGNYGRFMEAKGRSVSQGAPFMQTPDAVKIVNPQFAVSDKMTEMFGKTRIGKSLNQYLGNKMVEGGQKTADFFDKQRGYLEDSGEMIPYYQTLKNVEGKIAWDKLLDPWFAGHQVAGGAGAMAPALAAFAVTKSPASLGLIMGVSEKGSAYREFVADLADAKQTAPENLDDMDYLLADEMSDYYGIGAGIMDAVLPANLVKKLGGRTIAEATLADAIKQIPLTYFRNALRGGGAAGLSQLYKNALKKYGGIKPEQDLTEGLPESATSGIAMSLPFSTVELAGGFYGRQKYQSMVQKEQAEAIAAQNKVAKQGIKEVLDSDYERVYRGEGGKLSGKMGKKFGDALYVSDDPEIALQFQKEGKPLKSYRYLEGKYNIKEVSDFTRFEDEALNYWKGKTDGANYVGDGSFLSRYAKIKGYDAIIDKSGDVYGGMAVYNPNMLTEVFSNSQLIDNIRKQSLDSKLYDSFTKETKGNPKLIKQAVYGRATDIYPKLYEAFGQDVADAYSQRVLGFVIGEKQGEGFRYMPFNEFEVKAKKFNSFNDFRNQSRGFLEAADSALADTVNPKEVAFASDEVAGKVEKRFGSEAAAKYRESLKGRPFQDIQQFERTSDMILEGILLKEQMQSANLVQRAFTSSQNWANDALNFIYGSFGRPNTKPSR